MPLFLCSTALTWLKIQNTEKSGALLTLGCAQGIIFPSHEPEKDHFCSWPLGWSLGGDLPQRCHSHPGAPTPHGKSCCWDNTHGLPTAAQGQGHCSAFWLPSPAHHVPAPAHHIPTSAHHVSNENGQESQTTTQTQIVTQGKMTLSPQQNLDVLSLAPSSVYCNWG